MHEVGPVFACEAKVTILFGKVAEQHRDMGDVQRIAGSGQKASVKSVVMMGETSRVTVSDRRRHAGAVSYTHLTLPTICSV